LELIKYLLIFAPLINKHTDMILLNLEHSSRIQGLHPLFKQLFDYVKANNLLNASLGKIELKGDELYINNVNPECVSEHQQKLEVHHNYIDVHILLEGRERIGWKDHEHIKFCVKPYDSEEDCALYQDLPTTFVDLLPGQFAVFFPEDPHAPVIGKGKIRKLIAKVRIRS
jgi:YhcH/YjgK/YiaL family protein